MGWVGKGRVGEGRVGEGRGDREGRGGEGGGGEGRGGAEFCTGRCQVSNLRPSAFQYQPSPLIAAAPCRLTTSGTHHSL